MDPDACWSEILTIAHAIQDREAGEDDTERLAELLVALDEWLANGGFPPRSVYDRGPK